MVKKINILAVDDDPNILDSFRVLMEDNNDAVLLPSASFDQAKNICQNNAIDLAFIDVVLPEVDGYEICKTLKNNSNASKAVFVLMSAEKHYLVDRIRARKVGADEFLLKPFDLFEVDLIIKNKIKRLQDKINPNIINSGNFSVNKIDDTLLFSGKEINLTTLESDLLAYFLQHPEKFIQVNEIIENVWLEKVTDGNVRQAIFYLRLKIEPDPTNPIFLVSERLRGYIFYPQGIPVLR